MPLKFISFIPLLKILIKSLNIVVFPFPGGATIIVLNIVSFSLSITSLKIFVLQFIISLAILKFKLDMYFTFMIFPFSITHEPAIPTLCPPFTVINFRKLIADAY